MTVSLCVIAYNEENTIGKLIDDIKKQDYNHKKIEIVFVDNLSSDNTINIMNEFKSKDSSFKEIKICSCKTHMQASCWNEAIKNTVGDVIIRVDAHASIPKNFVRMNVLTILEGESVCGGGRPNRVEKNTPWQKTLLSAEEYMFGNFAEYRKKTKRKQYVDTLFHACYKREVFKKVGGFNESLGRTEDNEFHYRVRSNGYKICLSDNITSYQNVRSSFVKMLNQKFSNGLWIGLTLGVCPQCLSYLYFAPLLLVLAYLICFLLSILNFSILLSILSVVYTVFIISITVSAFIKNKFYPHFLLLPIIFSFMHFSYGIGTLCGIIKMPFWRKNISNQVLKNIDDIKKIV